MPKRTYDEKFELYARKMERLKEKQRRKRPRQESYSPSAMDDEVENAGSETGLWNLTEPHPDLVETSSFREPDDPESPTWLEPDAIQPNELPLLPAPALPAPTVQNETSQAVDDSSFPPLDPDILSALGEATDTGPTWGEEIHGNLTQLWQPLLKKGMTKENREKILKQYLIPSNCTLLQAPKLNIEISAAVIEMMRSRDKKVEASQQRLGAGIAAISKAMTSLLTSDNKIEAIRTLSDGCRILCDLHYTESQARIKMITPGLAKPFLNVIQDSERDETLFGTNLPEKIKASKTIEKQGLQIKKTPQPARSNQAAQNTIPARQFQGNWTGPPRYPTNRTTTSAQSRANQNRSRALART